MPKPRMSHLVVAVLAAALAGTGGALASQSSHSVRTYYLHNTDNAVVDSLDLRCVVNVNYNQRQIMLCQRDSDSPRSVYVIFYGDRIEVRRGNNSLTKPDKLLFSQARNP